MPNDDSKMSGWEVADKVAHGAGAAAHGVGWVLTKAWGALLLIAGLIVLFAVFAKGGWWAGPLLIAYGIYLLLPGSKWVLW
ncbi:hypothetical protein GCM10027449_26550 [Sinomonas notoginsengisoli]|uniref:hypothetical protein n=1 Tax=Sinomonas notoginsengisoli TaxID=1457311 RepID=UPI001F41BF7B|nr:hypothetical protein [Sinomonas notoginsengisoli]